MKCFLVHDNYKISYDQFIADLNELTYYSNYLYVPSNRPYEVFLSIVHSKVHGYPIELLDGDFSDIELENLGIQKEDITKVQKVKDQMKIINFQQLFQKMSDKSEWQLTLYTSGTTGRPKKVIHSWETITRTVKLHTKFEDDVWGFCYNPTHMAGLQVFFQALLNQNTIVYLFDVALHRIPSLFKKYCITNISATPTFYRNIIPYIKKRVFESVRRVTFGGEKYDVNLENDINFIFPNAKTANIYASTEAGSLFNAHADLFEIDGKIQNLIKINKDNELLIHSSLLGNFNAELSNAWFNTGDLVEMVDQSHFKFISRLSEMINVGGYKVNPIEIEEILLKVPGVIDVLVKARENRVTGQIIVADILKEDTFDGKELKKEIKKFASAHLQEWKVPRIITFIHHIPKTRTGKKDRK